MVTNPGPSSVDVGAEYCWRKFPKGPDRNAELERRLQLWEAEVHDFTGQKNILRDKHATADRRTACSIAVKGLVRGVAAGTAHRRQWTAALLPSQKDSELQERSLERRQEQGSP